MLWREMSTVSVHHFGKGHFEDDCENEKPSHQCQHAQH
jgi:hypothetical protein